ncbi:MAG TPA: hypothetical protein DCF48_03855, partial [Rikenellaceae bacterium]|nr:hypothetical protein [Rikenellaceae bacterium]
MLAVSCSKSVSVGNKVAVVIPDAAILDRWAQDKDNLKSIMGKYGVDAVFFTSPETVGGAAQQVYQLQDIIRSGYKYVVLTAIDYKKINASGVLAENPDVKVICHDRLVVDNPYIDYISSANTVEVGRMQAMFLLNHFHSSGAASMTIELLEGPSTDLNASDYYVGAMEMLEDYIDNGSLIVKSGKKTYNEVKADSWDVADGKKAMQDRLASYAEGEFPDMVLAANDNLAQGAIEALVAAGAVTMPVITGQDNTEMAQKNIKDHKQTMTIDKNL